MKTTRLLSVIILACLLPLTAMGDIWQDPETKVNYEYTPGKSEASVKSGSLYSAGSHDANGDITILAAFERNGQIYTVTSIGEHAFYNCSGITSVTIPTTVTTIHKGAFYGCKDLHSVNIGKAERV